MSRWSLVSFLEPHLDKINNQLKHDQELREAFTSATAGEELKDFAFAIVAAGFKADSNSASSETQSLIVRLQLTSAGSESFDVSISPETTTGQDVTTAVFALNAKQEHWEQFFQTRLSDIIRPYQSYWGMLRVLGADNNVFVGGDTAQFARYARVWRITLDRIRLLLAGEVYDTSIPSNNSARTDTDTDPGDEDEEQDTITGKYLWLTHTQYGRVKIFYEFSGSGPQNLLFLHTAGSDSRQYHSLMNEKTLQEKCTMYAFDLPGHGRSSLGTKQSIDTYALDEEGYIESIAKVIKKIGIKDLIVCGASMAGHICIALAMRARELGIRGSIPCEGCAHLSQPAAIYTLGSQTAPPSLLDPEKVSGMISPTSPEHHKRQIWWQYSSQANGVFAGDLKFYFVGWDGRGRLEGIDTGYCPVYMLTGQYDYSCTVEVSRETAKAIGMGKDGEGVMFESMPGLGHFPLTEDPEKVLPYLERAIEYIQKNRKG